MNDGYFDVSLRFQGGISSRSVTKMIYATGPSDALEKVISDTKPSENETITDVTVEKSDMDDYYAGYGY